MRSEQGPEDEPASTSVRTVHLCDEVVEIAGWSPEEVFTAAGLWLTEQRRISTGWTVTGAEWYFRHDPTTRAMQYFVMLRIDRLDDDARRPDGTRDTLADRLRWPLPGG